MRREIKFSILAAPAFAITAHAWLWIFGLVADWPAERWFVGTMFAVVNYVFASFACFGDGV